MKILIAVSLLFSLSFIALAQTTARAVTVSGDAEVRVVPDEVILNLGVESYDAVLASAKAANDAAIKHALDAASRLAIPPANVQTDYIAIAPHYHETDDTRQVVGYTVRKSLTIRLREIDKFERLLSDLLGAGVNVVHGIEFRSTELRKYRDQARLLALKAAREKAEALAGAAGNKIGQTLTINDSGGGWFSPYSSWWGGRYSYAVQNVVQNAGDASSVEGTLAPGQITVTAHVSLAVALE